MIWLLENIPSWLIHTILISGLISVATSVVLSLVPVVKQYAVPLFLAGVLLTFSGAFVEGATFINNKWLDRMYKIEEKIKQAEKISAEQNAKLSAQLAGRLQSIKDAQKLTAEEIAKLAPYIDAQCKITPQAAELYNRAAARPKDKK